MDLSFKIEAILGAVVTLSIAVAGFIFRQLSRDIDKAEKRIDLLFKIQAEDIDEVRKEIKSSVEAEETRRKEALVNIETRFNTQIQRVIDLVSDKHNDLKSDMRTIHTDIRELLKKDN